PGDQCPQLLLLGDERLDHVAADHRTGAHRPAPLPLFSRRTRARVPRARTTGTPRSSSAPAAVPPTATSATFWCTSSATAGSARVRLVQLDQVPGRVVQEGLEPGADG